MIIITESGSVYRINLRKKTWHRRRGANAIKIRTDHGTYTKISFIKDGILRMECPPINPPLIRVIESTRIVVVKPQSKNQQNLYFQ